MQSRLLLLSVAIVLLALVRSATVYTESYLFESVAHLVPFRLRGDLFAKLQRMSFGYHDRQQTGNLMSRATSDIDAVRYFPSYGIAHTAYLVLYAGGSATLMAIMNWRLGLVVLTLFSVALWRSFSVVPRLVAAWRGAQEETGHMSTVVQESISGIRAVKAFGAQRHEGAKFEGRAASVRRHQTTAGLLSVVRRAQSNLVFNAAVLVVLWMGAYEVAAGRLSPGEVATFMIYLAFLAFETMHAGFLVTRWSQASAAGARIFEVLDAESPVVERRGAVTLGRVSGHVRFEQVSFGYDDAASNLRGVDFEALAGQTVAILGPPGSGKSSLVHLIPRFYDATKGRITIDGVDVRDATLESLRRNVGIVMQDSFAFAATIADNIAYGVDEASDDDLARAAEAAHLGEFIEALPQGYDTWVGERGITLSGGQRQRLAIARTVLLDPPLLILDDSTSSVDVGTEYEIQRALARLAETRTTFVIAHRLSTVRNADLILVLDAGEIVERGVHQELIDRDGMYRLIHDLQLVPRAEALATGAHRIGVEGG